MEATPQCTQAWNQVRICWRAQLPEAEKDTPPVTVNGDADQRTNSQRRENTLVGKVLPWLLGVCLCVFLTLMAVGVFEALVDSSVFTRATPTPAFLAGMEIKLVEQDGASVTVWPVGGNCEVGIALGQMASGSDARILEDACYNRDRRTIFYRIALANGTTGWVTADNIVSAAEYTPPSPTVIPETEPTHTPWPTPTLAPTRTPPPPPLPLGSPLSTGNWGVRVDRVEIADVLPSPAGDKTVEATGRFALVFLTATNRGPGSKTLHASSVYIEDAEGNRYPNDDLASAYASSADCLDFALDIDPGESVCLVAAIDISTQSSYYVLSLQGAEEYVLLDVP